jgi:hypothetical protein
MVVGPHRSDCCPTQGYHTKPAARTGNTTKNLSAPKNFVAPTFRAFETVFKEPIYKVMEKIKREPFFVWPPKMLGNPALEGWKTLLLLS